MNTSQLCYAQQLNCVGPRHGASRPSYFQLNGCAAGILVSMVILSQAKPATYGGSPESCAANLVAPRELPTPPPNLKVAFKPNRMWFAKNDSLLIVEMGLPDLFSMFPVREVPKYHFDFYQLPSNNIIGHHIKYDGDWWDCTIAPSGALAAFWDNSTNQNNGIILVDLARPKEIFVQTKFDGPITSAVFFSDSRTLAFAVANKKSLVAFDISNKKVRWISKATEVNWSSMYIDEHDNVRFVDCDGALHTIGGSDGVEIKRYHLDRGNNGTKDGIWRVSTGGQWIYCMTPKRLYVYDGKLLTLVREIPVEIDSLTAASSLTGRYIGYISGPAGVGIPIIIDVATGKTRQLPFKSASAIGFARKSNRLAVGETDGKIRFWDIENGKEITSKP